MEDQIDLNRITPPLPSSQQMRDIEERDLDLRELNNGFASLGIDHRNNNNNNQGFSAGIESAYSALNNEGNEITNQFPIQSGLNSEVSRHKIAFKLSLLHP